MPRKLRKRKFNGKLYTEGLSYRKKSDAKIMAELMRADTPNNIGKLCIITSSGGDYPLYTLWSRNKRS